MQFGHYIITGSKQTKPQKVGTKAWNLFLLKENFAIPEFAVISTDVFDYYQQHRNISTEIEKQLRETLGFFTKNGAVAIRSSGTAEDLIGASFAGMYKTFLGVRDIESGIKAIIDVYESMNSERVKSYCKEMNIRIGSMAVIIQHQLNPEKSGVIITQSPYSINEILIECCSGFGEKLVSGNITPARYIVKADEIIEHRGEDLLTIEQVKYLSQTSKKIADIFKSPQEIEWAIENGKIYVVQARPITVRIAKPGRKCTVWCNANVRETIPDPISPMMWSFFDKFLFPMIMLNIFDIPVPREKFQKYPPIENLSGRLYWNINNTIAYGKVIGPLLDLLESQKNLDPQMVIAFDSIDKNSIPSLLSPIHSLMFSIVSLIRLAHLIVKSFFFHRAYSRSINNTNLQFEKTIEKLTISNNLRQGIQNIEDWMALKNFARKYFGGLFLSLFYMIIPERILGWRLGKKGKAIARKCAMGIVDNTVLIVKNLDNLASMAKTKIMDVNINTLKVLYQEDATFKSAFEKFIKEFGHRGPGEFDIASKTYSEDPELVMHLLCAPRTPRDSLQSRDTIINQILGELKPSERTIVKLFLPRLESYLPLRENGKHYYFKQMAKIKEQLFTIAEILIKEGFIREIRDIFFITFDELKDIADNEIKNIEIAELVEKRKQEWQLFKQTTVPDIIYESGERIIAPLPTGNIIHCEPLSFGKVRARARILKELKEANHMKKGEIMITHHTDPAWTPLFSIASGVIIEVGGFASHAATVAREIGIPAVVIKGACSIMKDGQEIELDADSGRVEIIPNM